MALSEITRRCSPKESYSIGEGEGAREEYFVSDTSSPERNLLVATLHRAIMDLRPMANTQLHPKEIRRTAIRWFKSESKKAWSFIWICTHLDLNHEIVRSCTMSWVKKGAPMYYNMSMLRRTKRI